MRPARLQKTKPAAGYATDSTAAAAPAFDAWFEGKPIFPPPGLRTIAPMPAYSGRGRAAQGLMTR